MFVRWRDLWASMALGRGEEGGGMKIAQLEKLHLFHLPATMHNFS